MQEANISPTDIIKTDEPVVAKNLDELLAHISARQGYFLSTLAAISSQELYMSGWQKIGKNDDGSTNKEDLMELSPEGVYTGTQWCATASVALGEALKKIIKANQLPIKIEMGDIDTDFFAEDRNRFPLRRPNTWHTILKLKDIKRKKTVYLDATYAQINHKLAGKIVQIPESKFPNYYAAYSKPVPTFTTFDAYPDKDVVTTHIEKREEFDHLVSTLL